MTSRRMKVKESFDRVASYITIRKKKGSGSRGRLEVVVAASEPPLPSAPDITLVKPSADSFNFVPDWEHTRKLFRINHLQREIVSLVLSPLEEAEISQATTTRFLCQFAELSILIRQQPLPSFYATKTNIERSEWTQEEMRALFVNMKKAFACEPPSEKPLIPAYRFKSIDRMLFNALDLFLGCVFDHEWCSLSPLADSYHPGTRKEYVDAIMEHLRSDSDQNVLWLYGLPRTGKSVVSWAVHDKCKEERRIGATLFFRQGRCEPSKVVCRLAGWLHDLSREVALMLAETVGTNAGIVSAPLREQFEKLIYDPLTKTGLDTTMKEPLAVILDGLDECGTPETRVELLALIREEFPRLAKQLRFFITSRPVGDIAEAFSIPTPSIATLYLDPEAPASRRDLARYIQKNIADITLGQHGIHPVPRGWTLWDNENMEVVEKVARGRFEWASELILAYKGTASPDWFLRVLEKACREKVAEMEKIAAAAA